MVCVYISNKIWEKWVKTRLRRVLQQWWSNGNWERERLFEGERETVRENRSREMKERKREYDNLNTKAEYDKTKGKNWLSIKNSVWQLNGLSYREELSCRVLMNCHTDRFLGMKTV